MAQRQSSIHKPCCHFPPSSGSREHILLLSPPKQKTMLDHTRYATLISLPQLHHHIRDLNILFRRVLCCDFKDDILLVVWDRLLADVFDEFTHPTAR